MYLKGDLHYLVETDHLLDVPLLTMEDGLPFNVEDHVPDHPSVRSDLPVDHDQGQDPQWDDDDNAQSTPEDAN